jgi:hypothetical protein
MGKFRGTKRKKPKRSVLVGLEHMSLKKKAHVLGFGVATRSGLIIIILIFLSGGQQVIHPLKF